MIIPTSCSGPTINCQWLSLHWTAWTLLLRYMTSIVVRQLSLVTRKPVFGSLRPGHMTKMATTPICGKNLKKSSSLEPRGRWPWNLVCSIRCSSTTKFFQMMSLGWPWPILLQGQIWSHAFVWEKCKTVDFSETIVVYDLQLATDDRSDKKFLLTSKLCPVCPLPRDYIHVLNREKNCIKSDFETCNKWVKW